MIGRGKKGLRDQRRSAMIPETTAAYFCLTTVGAEIVDGLSTTGFASEETIGGAWERKMGASTGAATGAATGAGRA